MLSMRVNTELNLYIASISRDGLWSMDCEHSYIQTGNRVIHGTDFVLVIEIMAEKNKYLKGKE